MELRIQLPSDFWYFDIEGQSKSFLHSFLMLQSIKALPLLSRTISPDPEVKISEEILPRRRALHSLPWRRRSSWSVLAIRKCVHGISRGCRPVLGVLDYLNTDRWPVPVVDPGSAREREVLLDSP